MPLYEYECKSCGNRFEKIQQFSDPLVTVCPKCGEESVEQMLSAPAFQFKGSGWYVSDYANKKSGDGAKAESGNGAKPETKDGANPETKTESKGETTSSASKSSETSSSSTSSSGESK